MEIISFFWTSAEIWKQIAFKAWLFRIPDTPIWNITYLAVADIADFLVDPFYYSALETWALISPCDVGCEPKKHLSATESHCSPGEAEHARSITSIIILRGNYEWPERNQVCLPCFRRVGSSILLIWRTNVCRGTSNSKKNILILSPPFSQQ